MHPSWFQSTMQLSMQSFIKVCNVSLQMKAGYEELANQLHLTWTLWDRFTILDDNKSRTFGVISSASICWISHNQLLSRRLYVNRPLSTIIGGYRLRGRLVLKKLRSFRYWSTCAYQWIEEMFEQRRDFPLFFDAQFEKEAGKVEVAYLVPQTPLNSHRLMQYHRFW